MWAHVERHGLCANQCSGCIRIFEDGQQFGDPYRYVFQFRFVSTGIIELYGVVGRAPKPSEARAMLLECSRQGWTVLKDRKSGAMVGRRAITRRSYKPKRKFL